MFFVFSLLVVKFLFPQQKNKSEIKNEEIISENNLSPSEPPKNNPDQLEILKYFQSGNFEKSLELIEKHLASEDKEKEFLDWLNAQYPNVLSSVGWLKLKTNQCHLAIENFKKALAKNPDHFESLKGMGFCLYQMKYWAEAEGYLRTAQKIDATDQDIQKMFIELYESEGRFEEGISLILQVLQEKKPGDLLQKKLKEFQSYLEESKEQSQYDTKNFSIKYRFDRHDPLITNIGDTLEQALSEYIDSWGFESPKSLIEVILIDRSVLEQSMTQLPKWSAGIYDGRIRIITDKKFYSAKNFETVLRHELIHALLHHKIPSSVIIPTWLNEGLAQFLECLPSPCKKSKFGTYPGKFLELESFEKSFINLNHQDADKAYRQSLYIVQSLERELTEDGLIQFIDNLKNLRFGSSEEVFKLANKVQNIFLAKVKKDWESQRKL